MVRSAFSKRFWRVLSRLFIMRRLVTAECGIVLCTESLITNNSRESLRGDGQIFQGGGFASLWLPGFEKTKILMNSFWIGLLNNKEQYLLRSLVLADPQLCSCICQLWLFIIIVWIPIFVSQARELKSVHLDAVGQFVKLVLHKNYVNKYNMYNQVRYSNFTVH